MQFSAPEQSDRGVLRGPGGPPYRTRVLVSFRISHKGFTPKFMKFSKTYARGWRGDSLVWPELGLAFSWGWKIGLDVDGWGVRQVCIPTRFHCWLMSAVQGFGHHV